MRTKGLRSWRENFTVFEGRALVEHKVDSDRFGLKTETRGRGELGRHKSHIFVRAFTQRPGVYFFETFSPLIDFDVVRTFEDETLEH